MFSFIKPKVVVKEKSKDNSYGKFVIEPLERGYGTTLGNSLRRVLLSSLKGSAVSQIKIDGVLHEFSTIKGVKEDVEEIILNIKSLVIKDNSGNDNVKYAYIEAKGNTVVKGSDIKTSDGIEILNPDIVIATLSGGPSSKLKMELTITSGIGYVSSEENKKNAKFANTISIDSIYTPIERVNINIEKTRVKQEINYDRLIVEIYTNKSIDVCKAIGLASKIIIEHLELLVDLEKSIKKISILKDEKKEVKNNKEKEIISLDDLDLSTRPSNCLKRMDINTVEELISMTEKELRNVKNLGKKSYEEIITKVKKIGKRFKK